MKFLPAIVSAFSVILVVHAVTAPNSNEDPSTPKYFKVTCYSENQAINCRSRVKRVESPNNSQQDKFYYSGFFQVTKFQFSSMLKGTCTKANEVLRQIESCGLQDCADIYCNHDNSSNEFSEDE